MKLSIIENAASIKNLINSFAVIALFTFPSSAAYAQGPLESLLEVYLVKQVATDEGVQETLTEADEAEPGSTLEYVLTYTNTGDQGLSGFVVKNPVPANTSYLADSASSSVGSNFTVSIDFGATYESEPVTRTVKDENGNEKEIVIPADQYNSVRWVVEESLEAGSEMTMKYRVSID